MPCDSDKTCICFSCVSFLFSLHLYRNVRRYAWRFQASDFVRLAKHFVTALQVCSGTTGHAEAVRFEYDPSKVKYEDLVSTHCHYCFPFDGLHTLRRNRISLAAVVACIGSLVVHASTVVSVSVKGGTHLQVEYFYRIHDPTTKNRQGNDVGTQYRSAIYYEDDEQKRLAEVAACFSGPIFSSCIVQLMLCRLC